MNTRTMIAGIISLPVNAVLFGTGAVAVLATPQLEEHAAYLLPAVIFASFLLTLPVAWLLAPRMRLARRSH
ncbi:hypothetical protein DFR52_101233 [Hoeflea marina]|uniref:Uncharacterized protein n=1 Tax=Hoeflea marina TaxID=274592 RepID=A0A317PQ08_9HYPH|nr:hypothetical protein [Hoeflea marina]PWW03552.1 hypothetical protein DFR52_101233 [Hoeflea marina]